MSRAALLDGIFQIAYVTNDSDRAAALLKERYGAGDFYFMRDIPNEAGAMTIALAYAGSMNIELIQPSASGPALYSDWIKDAGGFALRHHHYGMLINDEAGWQAMRARVIELGAAIPMEGAVPGGLDYLYADTTADLGHYLEYIRLYEGGREMFRAVPGSPF